MMRLLQYAIFLLISCTTYAENSNEIETQARQSIAHLYQNAKTIENATMADRITWFSKQFLGKKYVLGALGEGPDARYDQFPRYRADAFDCDTYVNTVLSLALANSAKSFEQCMQLNRYKDGKIAYIQRNHFTSLDWNQNNQQRGIFKDITTEIKDKNNQPVAVQAQAFINKSAWYACKKTDSIRLQKENAQEAQKRLSELKLKGAKLKSSIAKIPYLPFTALFKDDKPNEYLFAQIPNGAIIEIVRPNWDLSEEICTHLNVSHLGIAIWSHGILYFREASSQYMQVVDVPLIEYLQQASHSPTIKGINVQIVVPTKPLASCA